MLRPSAGDGLSISLAPNTLRHFSILKKNLTAHPNLTSARLLDSRFTKHRGATLA